MTSSPGLPEPRWSTRRRPERKTFGPRLGRIAEAFGQPFMPWQQLVADVAGEYYLDDQGKPVPYYRTIIISVPRQNGKTTLLLAFEVDRCLSFGRAQRVIYSAQTGRDAQEKLLEDQYPLLHASGFKLAMLEPVRKNGGEAIRFKNGSRISIVASDEAAGHGKTIGLGVIDEAFKDVDNRREQSLTPAMRTVRDSQLIVASTMGTDASIYLNGRIDAGRAASTEDRDDSRLCYFEWSAPEDADISDPAVWAACTPALGYTIELGSVRAEYENNLATPGEFKRFALNQRTASDERVIPLGAWTAVCDVDVEPEPEIFALDCNPERSRGSIAVADGSGRLELLDSERGIGWMVPRAIQLRDKWGSNRLVVDPAGPAGALIPELRAANLEVIEVSGQEFTKACGLFYDAVTDGECQIRTDPRLDAACAAAAKRPSGDAWAWTRKSSSVDISPIVTVTLAYWVSQQIRPASSYWSASDL